MRLLAVQAKWMLLLHWPTKQTILIPESSNKRIKKKQQQQNPKPIKRVSRRKQFAYSFNINWG